MASGAPSQVIRSSQILEQRVQLAADFGDAPDLGPGAGLGDYETLAANGGPSHTIVPGLYLGATVDGDAGDFQDALATGDDVGLEAPDDEDGVPFPQLDFVGTVGAAPVVSVLVTNATDAPALLYGWIDYNQDGTFDSSTERASASIPTATTSGRYLLQFPAIPSGASGTTYLRLRLSTDPAAQFPIGPVADGEVEDHRFTITMPGSPVVDRVISESIAGEFGPPVVATGDSFGAAVSAVGDINLDGVPDLVVGAPGHSGGGALHLLVLQPSGSVTRTVTISQETTRELGLSSGDRFGSSVAFAGDIDGDTIGDLVVGVERHGDRNGSLRILFLNPNGTVKASRAIDASTDDTLSFGSSALFGSAVATVGDLDGNGVVDLAVGASGDDAGGPNRGAAYILFLERDGTVKQTTKLASGQNGVPDLGDFDRFGGSIASIGDLNGDGVSELAIGAYGDDSGGPSRGSVYLLWMRRDGTAERYVQLGSDINGGPQLENNEHFGSSVATVEDLDGNGVDDLVVGARRDKRDGIGFGAIYTLLLNNEGSVTSYTRISSKVGGGPTLRRNGYFGTSVASAGDVNGDGVADLFVGAPARDDYEPSKVAVYALFMDTNGNVDGHAKVSHRGAGIGSPPIVTSRQVGRAVAQIGDLDADGIPDVAIGTAGTVQVRRLNADGTIKGVTTLASRTNGIPDLGYASGFGRSIAALGDLDSDGTPDIAVGTEANGEASIFVLFLRPNGTVHKYAVVNNPAGSSSEQQDIRGSITPFGDLNGDGTIDLLVGGKSPSGSHFGASVLLLNSDGTVLDVVTLGAFPGMEDIQHADSPVAVIPDLDRNGIPEIVIGDEHYTQDGARGRILVLFPDTDLSVQRVAPITSEDVEGATAFRDARFGTSVAAIGDLNGDGVSDIAIGEADYRLGGSVNILLLDSDGLPKATYRITSGEESAPGVSRDSRFGESIATAGDIDGNGVTDLIVGAIWTRVEGEFRGVVYTMLLAPRLPDYGDAPDLDYDRSRNYATLESSGGPWHGGSAGYGLRLGREVDGDGGGLQGGGAVADDGDGVRSGDEDGVVSPSYGLQATRGTVPEVTLLVTNTTGRPAMLSGWIDYNSDSTFHNVDERAQAVIKSGTIDATVTLTFPRVPRASSYLSRNQTYARFRLSTDSAAHNATGAASDGEVEDHVFRLVRPGSERVAYSVDSSAGISSTWPNLSGVDGVGTAVAAIGDVDGDGVIDFAVGSREAAAGRAWRGQVHVVLPRPWRFRAESVRIGSNTDNHPVVNAADQFGGALAGVGDIDRDGIPDLAAGAQGSDIGGANRGAVHLLMLGKDGSVGDSITIASDMNGGPSLADGDRFGVAVAVIGDLDGNGVMDLAVGADRDDTSGTDRGAVYILFLGPNGIVLRHAKVASGLNGGPVLRDRDRFGYSVAGIGDVDGDGIVDVAVGAFGDDTGGPFRGAVYVLMMNADGTVRSSSKIADDVNGGPTLKNRDYFGRSLAGMGDVDGDGVPEIAVGTPGDDVRGRNAGAVHIVRLTSSGSVKRTTRLEGSVRLTPGWGFGSSVAAVVLGVNNGDSVVDLIVGAPGTIAPDLAKGAVYAVGLSAQGDVKLPERGGAFEVLRKADELIVRQAGGAVLLRELASDVLHLEITGSDSDDRVTVLESSSAVDVSIEFVSQDGDDLFDAAAATGAVNVRGGSGSSTLIGGFGDDTLRSGSGGSVLIGGPGNDSLLGSRRMDTLEGGDGDDTLDGGSGYAIVREFFEGDAVLEPDASGSSVFRLTGRGTDRVLSASGALLIGNSSAQSIDASRFSYGWRRVAVTLDGAGGDDSLLGSPGSDVLIGAAGDDYVDAGAGDDRLFGGAGSDTLVGGSGDDLLRAHNGQLDHLSGGEGDDTLDGGKGRDRLVESGDADIVLTGVSMSGLGDDIVRSVEGAEIQGGESDNIIDVSAFPVADSVVVIYGHGGNDSIIGTGGPDSIDGGAGSDVLHGGDGSDTLIGGDGNDRIRGGVGQDRVSGGDGADVIEGGRSHDIAYGGAGSDTLLGEQGFDILIGGEGDDSLQGGNGRDTLVGGTGNNDADSGDQFLDDLATIDELFQIVPQPLWLAAI